MNIENALYKFIIIIIISFIDKALFIMKVFSLTVHDSTQHNRKPIITTKVFTFL